jgi:hypothetical protein
MADVIDDALSHLKPEDMDVIAEFITTLTSIRNEIDGDADRGRWSDRDGEVR